MRQGPSNTVDKLRAPGARRRASTRSAPPPCPVGPKRGRSTASSACSTAQADACGHQPPAWQRAQLQTSAPVPLLKRNRYALQQLRLLFHERHVSLHVLRLLTEAPPPHEPNPETKEHQQRRPADEHVGPR